MYKLSDIANILKKNDYFYILTHMYPDGDALGSAFALCRALQKIGKHAKVICDNPLPEKFQYLTEFIKKEDFDFNYILAVDLADTALLESNSKKYIGKIDLCIDHHMSNKNYAKINFINSKAAANCEIIYNLLNKMEIILDPEISTALYTGIATDTGCFQYSNTTSDTHFITSELIKHGAQFEQINEKLFLTKTRKKIELEKIIYKNLEYRFNSKCAITHVTLKEMEEIGIGDNELDGIASIPIKIEGVQIGITIREKSENFFKVSVRTSSYINADEFCKNFNGGGHARAGGFSIFGNINNVKNEIANKIKSIMEW